MVLHDEDSTVYSSLFACSSESILCTTFTKGSLYGERLGICEQSATEYAPEILQLTQN